jgi:predicted phage-related endonuclease
MKIIDLVQGSPEWHAHRATHWNASEAPVMLGVSPHCTRDEMLRAYATGIPTEITEFQERIFAAGHAFEALARPLAEQIVGEDLYPCVGADGRYSASFDGLTLLEDTAFEHKAMNDDLRALLLRIEDGEPITGADLREDYRVQMEQQCLVSGATRVLFMSTRWEGDELAEQFWCWYLPDPELRARIVAGWPQFERDRQDWQPVEHKPQPVAAPVEGFGVLALRVEGRVLASNLDAFRAGADAFLARLPRPADLQTDQDFADADAAAKACADAEERIKAAKDMAMAQMADVDAVLRTADTIAETIRRARLALEKAVAAEKESRKAALVRIGVEAVHAHYAEINATLGEHRISVGVEVPAAVGASIKGLKSLSSMRDRINTAVASAKIDASQRADRIRACIAVLAEHAEHQQLFPDHVQLCATKAPDDLRNLVSSRIAEHQRREQERERERVRQQQEAEQPSISTISGIAPRAAQRVSPAGQCIRLGEINALISPLSISAEGLAQLGFPHVATDKAAKLYAVADMPRIVEALVHVLRGATAREVANG